LISMARKEDIGVVEVSLCPSFRKYNDILTDYDYQFVNVSLYRKLLQFK